MPALGPVVIGVDCSTTGSKAVAFVDGRAVAEARRPYDKTAPHYGWQEQNPVDWWTATSELRDRRTPVAALAITPA